MLASLFFSAGDLVFVEDPSYFAALRTLQHDLGLKCIPCKLGAKFTAYPISL